LKELRRHLHLARSGNLRMPLCTRLNALAEIGLNLRRHPLAEHDFWFLCEIAVRDLWEVHLCTQLKTSMRKTRTAAAASEWSFTS